MLSRPPRPFLDWPIVTDPAAWQADVAIVGIPLSEPYPRDPWPNDQANAPHWVRRQSIQFCDGRDHWDFDNGAPLGEILPARCLDGVGLLAPLRTAYTSGQITELGVRLAFGAATVAVIFALALGVGTALGLVRVAVLKARAR